MKDKIIKIYYIYPRKKQYFTIYIHSPCADVPWIKINDAMCKWILILMPSVTIHSCNNIYIYIFWFI